jgi:hypothetical protein
LTKTTNPNRSLQILIDTNEIKIRVEGRVKRDAKKAQKQVDAQVDM